MTQTLKNLSRRPVSLRGNSGQSWHIPPGASIEMPDFETSDNPKLRKLVERRLLGLIPPEKKEHEAGGETRGRGRRSRSQH
jgi:hypothetical protein